MTRVKYAGEVCGLTSLAPGPTGPMKYSDDNLLVCPRVVAGYEPAVPSRVGVCCECGHYVWRAMSSPVGEYTVMCMECLRQIIHEHPEEEIEVVPPTPTQVKDILKHKRT